MNLTRERIRQVETRGLLKLREATPRTSRAGPPARNDRRPPEPTTARPPERVTLRSTPTEAAWSALACRLNSCPRTLEGAPFRRCTWSAALSSSVSDKTRTGPVRAAARRARLRAPLHRWHARGARRRGPAGHARSPSYTQAPGDPRRPGEDAPPADPRRHPVGRGLAADRGGDGQARDIEPIDLVVVNLYPFRETVARRAAVRRGDREDRHRRARRWSARRRRTRRTWRWWWTRPTTTRVLGELEQSGAAREPTALLPHAQGLRAHRGLRRGHRRVPVARGSASGEPRALPGRAGAAVRRRRRTSATARTRTRRAPSTATRREPDGADGGLRRGAAGQGALLQQHARPRRRAAPACSSSTSRPAPIIKHNTPVRRRRGDDGAGRGVSRARAPCDPVSAFGGIVALQPRGRRRPRRKELAETFLECVIAPGFTAEARAALAAKKNLRLLEARALAEPRATLEASAAGGARAALDGGRAARQDRDLGARPARGLEGR